MAMSTRPEPELLAAVPIQYLHHAFPRNVVGLVVVFLVMTGLCLLARKREENRELLQPIPPSPLLEGRL
jgi:hypothetical protein